MYYLPSGTIVSPTTSPRQYEGSVEVIVTNLPPNADVAVLYNLFAPYGRILSAQINVDSSNPSSSGSCTGTGTVQMEGIAQAQHAIQMLNDVRVFDPSLPPIKVAFIRGDSQS